MKGIENTVSDIRNPAYECMVELYRIMGGDEISKYYDGLGPAQLKTLQQKFAEVDEQSGAPTKQKKKVAAKQQEVIETNIGKPQGSKKSSSPARQAKKQQ